MKNLTAARDAVGSEEPIAAGGWCFCSKVESFRLSVERKCVAEHGSLSTLNSQLSTN
jgi:hypothetical protein